MMSDLVDNADLLFLCILAFAGMAVLTVRLYRKRLSVRFIGFMWAVLVVILGLGFFWVRQEESGQRRMWNDYLCGLTATFADTTQHSGHDLIRPRKESGGDGEKTAGAIRPVKIVSFEKTLAARSALCREPEVYEKIIQLHTDWCRDLKNIGYVTTYRKIGEKQIEFVCCCPSDIDRDGVFEGFLEVGEPPFTPYMENDKYYWQEIYEKGFNGETAIDPSVNSGLYGRWVTAVAPLYGPDRKIEAIFTVDFFVDDWMAKIRAVRTKAVLLWIAILLLYFVCCAAFAGMKESIASFREMNEHLVLARQEAESATRAKEIFLANMSHEIRTPMNAVLGMIHLVQRTELSEKQVSYVEKAEQSARLLLRIIGDILDFSKIEAGRMNMERNPLSLKLTLSELYGIVAEAARKKNLELVFDMARDVPDEIVGDAIRIKQILLNLVNNAVKFTNRGSIRLTVRRVEMDNMSVTLRFSVADTGIGIAEDQIDKLFTPFMQADMSTSRKFGGTGLGLAICKSLVDMMDGKIWCESRAGEGTVFHWTARFERPGLNREYQILMEDEPDDAETDETVVGDEEGKRILLVEDNAIDQAVARDILAAEGFHVTVAENGVQALRIMESEDFDLVLMDIQMPEMDGIETTIRIRRNPRYDKLPIIAMTAHAMTGDREENLKAGMNDCINKPIAPELMFQIIAKWTKGPS